MIPACPSTHPPHPFSCLQAEAEAERKKRAAILDSEGVRQACSLCDGEAIALCQEACSPVYWGLRLLSHDYYLTTICVVRCHAQAQINRAEGEKQARVLDSEAERQQMSTRLPLEPRTH